MQPNKTTSPLAKFATPLIILATIIWGSSFVVMKSSVDVLPTFWLLAIRFTFAALVLAVVFLPRWKVCDKQYLVGGTVMGFCLFVAYAFQTFGLERTTPGKNAFLTAVYCVIVPFLYWAIARRRPDRYNILAALLCIVGIGLVSVTGESASAVNLGDILTLVGGFFFACHIVAVAKYSEGRDIFILTAIQFASFALFSWIGVLVTGAPVSPEVFDQDLIFGLAYLVVFASAGALLFQNIGQKYTAPATAAVLLSLEAPFGVVFSIIFADERPTVLMFIGFALIFVAVVCSETKFSFLRKKETSQG
ncbi:DMT family transporter [Pseudoflavonifractor phocaeensis]|uniref:DMT family transporter n=1 Tax=Pseudoflavonifractor phocaeensis TaxID=1870988 RepID=UPI00195A2BAA|nr:DMT family transporter [Pseudoflavonifractor phocaeensis]MBM6926442.1 DMT family transporter [Pseudoflavonifractor phocaeensis]